MVCPMATGETDIDSRGEDGRGVFTPLARTARLSDRVADAMTETIFSQGLKAGDRLPSERELGEQFGVSRTVIREAVRSLAAKGLIEIRTGSGLWVTGADAGAVRESMNLLVRSSRGIDYPKIHEVRSILETRVAYLAAQRADDAGIARMRELCEHMATILDDTEAMARADVLFHREIAEMAQNELFVVLIDALGDTLLEIRRSSLTMPGRAREGLEAHKLILERIAARDADGARAAMQAHLDDSERIWREHEVDATAASTSA